MGSSLTRLAQGCSGPAHPGRMSSAGYPLGPSVPALVQALGGEAGGHSVSLRPQAKC